MPFTVFGTSNDEVQKKVQLLYGSGCAQQHSQKDASTAASAPVSGATASAQTQESAEDDASTALLSKLDIYFKSFDHPKSATVADWTPHCLKHAPNAHICKNLLLKDKKKKDLVVIVVALASTDVSTSFVQKVVGGKNLRMAGPEILSDKLGLEKGAVTPLVAAVDPQHMVTFVFDAAMLEAGRQQPLLFHPLAGNHRTVAIATDDLVKYLGHTGHEFVTIDFAAQKVLDQ